nr:HdeD family acid-resistance protein [Fodinibius sp.]
LSGIFSIVLGVLMIVWPAASAVAIAFMVGLYAILFGATLILLGIRFKNFQPGENQVLNYS